MTGRRIQGTMENGGVGYQELLVVQSDNGGKAVRGRV